jgi:hypothetical protein
VRRDQPRLPPADAPSHLSMTDAERRATSETALACPRRFAQAVARDDLRRCRGLRRRPVFSLTRSSSKRPPAVQARSARHAAREALSRAEGSSGRALKHEARIESRVGPRPGDAGSITSIVNLPNTCQASKNEPDCRHFLTTSSSLSGRSMIVSIAIDYFASATRHTQGHGVGTPLRSKGGQ